MSDHKCLQVFTFSDNFGWSFADVQAEALNAANRRADMMGWTEVTVKPVATVPTQDGTVRNYRFEIWGLGEAVHESSDGQPSGELAPSDHRQVARESDVNP